MLNDQDDTSGERPGRLTDLVEELHQTFQRIREVTGDGVDAVLHPESGNTYLLPGAQEELLRMEVTERRHAMERAAILDALPAQIALLDRDGRIVAVNEAWRAFGRANGLATPDSAVGQNYLQVCTGAGGPDSECAARVAEGIGDVIAGGKPRFSLEYPCHSPDEQRWFQLVVTPLDPDGSSGVVVMHIDISARVLAQHRAEELGRRLERLIDQARVGILVHRNLVPVLANVEFARLFGYDSVDEITGMDDCRALFADHERERLSGYYHARAAGGYVPECYRVEGIRRDGARRIMENRAFTMEWDGRFAVCAMLTDITEQVETEEQLRQAHRLDAVGQLTGGVAHDFNNLLTVILGNAELLSRGWDHDPRMRSLVEMTIKAAERGAELTSQLLAFARRQPLEPKAVDVNARILAMDGLLRRTLGEEVEIQVVAPGDTWKAMVDAGQLDNAILNLCINARDAMPSGGRLVIEIGNVILDEDYTRRHSEVAPGEYVAVSVSDTGSGMDQTTLKRAFEPFYTTKEEAGGSGLGLSMVYGFVKQSRGHVRLYSEIGEGTMVRLYLPRAGGDEAQTTEERAVAHTVIGGKEHILVVEDDSLVREQLIAQLTGLGYSVTGASSGKQALEILERESGIALLFTDIIMPGGMNGRQLAEAALAFRPGLKVLYTSGYSENAIIHQGRLDPGVHLLSKPYRLQQMAAKVRAVLDEES